MTKTNSTASKLFVAFVATAMLFTLSYAPAKAATADELQAQIDALLAQIAGMTTGGSSSSCAQFTMDLTMGSTGAEVTALQNFLIGAGHAIAAGATGYFGGQTQAALSAYQSANGISPAAGYFGPITRAKVNASCTTSGGDDDSNDDSNDDDSSNDDSDEELSGEASLDDVTMNDGDDTDLEEGQEDAPVAEAEFEFADGDAKITRIDVAFVGTGDETEPWDAFEEVSLWVDGDEVARMDASDEDEYLDEDDGSLRFSGLDIVGMEDEAVTVVIGVTVQDSVELGGNADAWTVAVDTVRYVDADDVSTTDDSTPDLGDTVSFDIDEEGGEDELVVKSSSEDPDATTIAVEESDKSDWTTIFAFDLDTDDSVNDIEVNELTVGVVTDTDVVNQVVSDVQLVIDGETYDDVTWVNNTTATATAVFDIDGDLVIEAGERVTAEFQVEFKQLTGNFDEGDTIFARASSTPIDAEGADDLVGAQLQGSATGETHTLRTEGAILEAGDMSETFKENNDASTTDNAGIFVVKFDVTAFETDLFVTKTATRGTTLGTAGANYVIIDSSTSGTATTTGSIVAATLTSTADTESGNFKVAEGETETFTLTVEFDPSLSSGYQLQLYSLNWDNVNDAAPDTQQLAVPAEDYQTDPLTVSN